MAAHGGLEDQRQISVSVPTLFAMKMTPVWKCRLQVGLRVYRRAALLVWFCSKHEKRRSGFPAGSAFTAQIFHDPSKQTCQDITVFYYTWWKPETYNMNSEPQHSENSDTCLLFWLCSQVAIICQHVRSCSSLPVPQESSLCNVPLTCTHSAFIQRS